MRGAIDVVLQRLDALPDREVEQDPVVVVRAQVGRVSGVGLQPPDEAFGAVGEGVDLREARRKPSMTGDSSGAFILPMFTCAMWYMDGCYDNTPRARRCHSVSSPAVAFADAVEEKTFPSCRSSSEPRRWRGSSIRSRIDEVEEAALVGGRDLRGCRRVAPSVRISQPVREMTDGALRHSHAYIRYEAKSGGEFLAAAWTDAAHGINNIIDVYGKAKRRALRPSTRSRTM